MQAACFVCDAWQQQLEQLGLARRKPPPDLPERAVAAVPPRAAAAAMLGGMSQKALISPWSTLSGRSKLIRGVASGPERFLTPLANPAAPVAVSPFPDTRSAATAGTGIAKHVGDLVGG